MARSSPYLVAGEKVDAEIAARLEAISHEPRDDTDFAEPERAPIIETLERAQQNLKRSRPPSPEDEPLPRGAPHLRVLDGGKDGDNS